MKLLDRTVHLVMDLTDEIEEMSLKSLYGQDLDYVSENGEKYRIIIAERTSNMTNRKDPQTN